MIPLSLASLKRAIRTQWRGGGTESRSVPLRPHGGARSGLTAGDGCRGRGHAARPGSTALSDGIPECCPRGPLRALRTAGAKCGGVGFRPGSARLAAGWGPTCPQPGRHRCVAGFGDLPLTDVVAEAYFTLLTPKDEYEVARLYTDGSFAAKLAQQFEPGFGLSYHMAPPILSRPGSRRKLALGPWMTPLLRLLARCVRCAAASWTPSASPATAARTQAARPLRRRHCPRARAPGRRPPAGRRRTGPLAHGCARLWLHQGGGSGSGIGTARAAACSRVGHSDRSRRIDSSRKAALKP